MFGGLPLEHFLEYYRLIGCEVTHPYDESLEEGNEVCGVLKPYALQDLDCEDFYHRPFNKFSCHIPNCQEVFDTIIAYEAHYHTCHSFTCQECRKNFPNSHLLDLHISETHDFFFAEQAKRKPMFRCFSEECTESFKDPKERREHCIAIHKYPADFRYDALRRKKCVRNKQSTPISTKEEEPTQPIALPLNLTEEELVEVLDAVGDEELTQLGYEVLRSSARNSTPEPKVFNFGHANQRKKPIYTSFARDLKRNLPHYE